MFKVVVHGSTVTYNRVFTDTAIELNSYLHNLMKSHKTFDIFKDGKLVATGSDEGIRRIKQKKSVVRGSVGYAKMMSER